MIMIVFLRYERDETHYSLAVYLHIVKQNCTSHEDLVWDKTEKCIVRTADFARIVAVIFKRQSSNTTHTHTHSQSFIPNFKNIRSAIAHEAFNSGKNKTRLNVYSVME